MSKIHKGSWKTIREKILIRDDYRCVKCGRPGRLEVDHVKPVNQGGSYDDPKNLQTLCRECHISKTKTEREAIRGPRYQPGFEKLIKEMQNA